MITSVNLFHLRQPPMRQSLFRYAPLGRIEVHHTADKVSEVRIRVFPQREWPTPIRRIKTTREDIHDLAPRAITQMFKHGKDVLQRRGEI